MEPKGRFLTVVLAALVGVLVGAALLWTALQRGLPELLAESASGTPVSSPPLSRQSEDAITAAIARVGPAVVNISTLVRPPVRDPLERIWRDIMGIPSEPFPRPGQGSGIIIDGQRGYVLTNAHVVKGAAQVEVSLASGQRFEAHVAGVDPLSDIAVLQVPGRDLPAATLGSAADLPIGSWVIAIGNPFGFENSVTVGVLSAKDRQIKGPDGRLLQDLLQTDASINPGNSGGALVDLTGAVVGIPTAIIPYAQGMGFAVSVDVAKEVAERLIATGKMPWFGIIHRDLLLEETERLRVPEGKGALVWRVVPGGPSDKAGIRPGDVITRLGDRRVDNARSFGAAVRSYDAGERINVTVWREGRELVLTVRLGEVPAQGFAQPAANPAGSGSRGSPGSVVPRRR